MKPIHLAAIAVLIVAIIMVARPTHQKGTGADAPAAIAHGHTAAAGDSNPDLPEATRMEADNSITDPGATTGQVPAIDDSSRTGAPSIRLADDVKLPAVILALMAAEKDTAHPVPAPVAAAMRGIVDTFYNDLATGTGDTPDGTPFPEPIVADDNTILIEAGPAVERARARANETYRALFGDEAYNRMTMNSVLEVQSTASGE